MNYFDFGDYLIKWIDLLYKDFKVTVQNNGNFSQEISVTCSIHQGGCCSAEIFLICAETLAIELRSKEIKGVKIGSIEQFFEPIHRRH